jgi:hypothetical protein
MQTNEEVVKVFFPMAKVTFHPGGSGVDSICIGSPRVGSGSFDVLSKCFPLDTDEGLLWDDAYRDLVARARVLIDGDAQRATA